MKSYQWARVGLWSLVVAGASARDASAEEWVSLFDGKTLSGWTQGGGEGKSHWEVKDGAITASGSASMLYSPKSYKNFKYRAEVKISDHGNSGLYFRCPTPNGSFSEGYEAQINSTHADPIRTGSIYGFVHVYNAPVPPDEWFTYELEVVDKEWRGMVLPHITVKINGEVFFMFMDRTNAWKEGRFAFQQHDPGSKVHIRKIEVVELP